MAAGERKSLNFQQAKSTGRVLEEGADRRRLVRKAETLFRSGGVRGMSFVEGAFKLRLYHVPNAEAAYPVVPNLAYMASWVQEVDRHF